MRPRLKKENTPFLHWALFWLLFTPLVVQAQKEEKFIGEVRSMNVVEAQCTLADGIYEIRFRDVKKRRFPKYASFHFPDVDNNYFKLKNILLKGFDSVPEDAQLLDFTREKVEIEFTKSAGLISFRFALHEGKKDNRIFSSWFSKGKAEKIFGNRLE